VNKPNNALTVPGDDRFLDMLAERVSSQLYADYEVVEDDHGSIDLRAIWSAVYRNRWLIVGVIAVALSLGVISILLTTPTYRAQATVQIDQQAAKVLGTEDTEPVLQAQEADRFLQTQVDVIKSRELASRVANDLQLNGNPSFIKAMGAKPLPSGSSFNEVMSRPFRSSGIGCRFPCLATRASSESR
jgi:hypothetical protein